MFLPAGVGSTQTYLFTYLNFGVRSEHTPTQQLGSGGGEEKQNSSDTSCFTNALYNSLFTNQHKQQDTDSVSDNALKIYMSKK